MAFSVNDENRIRQLVELTASVEPTNDPDSVDLKVTLLIQPDELDIGDYTISVDFSEAFLSLEAFGCAADHSTKYGMRRIAENSVRTQATEKSVKAAVSKQIANEAVVSSKLALVDSALEVSGKVNEVRSQTTDVTLTVKEDQIRTHFPVEAIGNDRWKITGEHGEGLAGYFLTDERLCRLVKGKRPTNRFGASLSLKVKRRDIRIEVTDNRTFLKLEKTKEKLLAILLAKHFEKSVIERDGQAITFSETVVDDQGQ